MIEEEDEPVLHNNEPEALVDKTDDPQLSVTVTTGVTGTALMVIAAEANTPQLLVYLILAVPAVTPVTIPDAFTEATAVLSLLHTPPVVAEANAVVIPAQILVVPVIAATVVGATITLKVFVVTFKLASVAVTVTVVVPAGKMVPGFLL